jgi:hypothetical protein
LGSLIRATSLGRIRIKRPLHGCLGLHIARKKAREGTAKAEQQILASRSGAVVTVEASDVPQIRVLWNDAMADLDKDVQVTLANPPLTLWDGKVERTIGTLFRTLEERGDRRLMFSAEVLVRVPKS